MKKPLYIILVVMIAFFIYGLTPMNTAKENCVEVSGTIQSIREGGIKDMVFELENDKITYYINRGFENGFEINKAKKDFVRKKVRLFYVKSWTPLAPFGTTNKHISHLIVNDSVMYNEW